MPDMVETYAGVGAEPWWLGSSPTAQHAEMLPGNSVDLSTLRVAAGLDWTVSKQPAFVTGEHAQRIKGWNAVQRDTDGAIYGLVKDTYRLLQNEEAFDFVQAVLDESPCEGLTAGSLYGGAIGWVLVKLDADVYIHGDGSALEDYLLATWGHNGRYAFTLADTSVRVVCANTLTAGVKGAKAKTSIRHTAGMAARIEAVRKALDIQAKYRVELVARLNDLTTRPMTIEQVKAFTEVLLPVREGIEPDRAYRTIAERQAIVSLYERSDSLSDLDETAYRVYQAVTQYLDHEKAYRTTKTGQGFDRRASAIIDGSAYSLKTASLALLAKA